MATQYSPKLKLALPVQGELSGTWGDVVNDNITSMVEEAIAGLATIDTWTTNSHTLTTANGTTSESRAAMLLLTDSLVSLSGAGTLICPTSSKVYIVKNSTAQTVTLKTVAGTGVAIPSVRSAILYCDGTNVVEALNNVTGNMTVGGTLGVTGAATFSNNLVVNGLLNVGTTSSVNVIANNHATNAALTVRNLGAGPLLYVANTGGSNMLEISSTGAATFSGGTQVLGNVVATSSGTLSLKTGKMPASISNSTDAYVGVHDTGGLGTISGDLLLVSRTSTGVQAAIRMFTGDTTPVQRLVIDHLGAATFSGNVTIPLNAKLFLDAGLDTYIEQDVNNQIRFVAASAEALRLVDNTAAQFQGVVQGFSTEAFRAVGTIPYYSFYDATNTTLRGYVQHNGSGAALNIVNAETGGNVGFFAGNTQRLTIDGTSGAATFSSTVSGVGELKVSRSGNANQYQTIANDLGLTTLNAANTDSATRGAYVFNATNNSNTVEHMRLEASGNLLVGRSSVIGSEVLGLEQTASDWAAYTRNTHGTVPYGMAVIYTANVSNAGSAFLYCATNTSTVKFSVASNGGISNFQANDVNLSDEREKNQFGLLGSTTDCVRSWEVVKYLYKHDDQELPHKYGVIAQQVALHCPEVIETWVKQDAAAEVLWAEGDELPEGASIGDVKTPAQERIERQGVKEQQMFWMLVKSHQEALDTIEALTARLDAAGL